MTGAEMSKYFVLILITVSLNATSQILMKNGMAQIGQFEYSGARIASLILAAFTSPIIILGLTTMSISMVTHLMSLSRFEVSFAFPFLSIAYVIVSLYGYLILQENMSLTRIAGIATIILGTILISRS
jgi:multidrug transporter EmrE-like cation transporter